MFPWICFSLICNFTQMIVAVIILCVAAVYAWIVYPFAVLLIASLMQRRKLSGEKDLFQPEELPQTAVIISAYNEEAHIAGRIRNILESDFPADKLAVWIGIDGSSDKTAANAGEAYETDERVHILEFPGRRGLIVTGKQIGRAHV